MTTRRPETAMVGRHYWDARLAAWDAVPLRRRLDKDECLLELRHMKDDYEALVDELTGALAAVEDEKEFYGSGESYWLVPHHVLDQVNAALARARG